MKDWDHLSSGLIKGYLLGKYFGLLIKEINNVVKIQNYIFNVRGENSAIEWFVSIYGHLNTLNINLDVQEEIISQLHDLSEKYKEAEGSKYLEYDDAIILLDTIINWEKTVTNSLANEFYKSCRIGEPIIFIGHGHNDVWKELKDHLINEQKFIVETYESEERAGHIVPNNIEKMIQKSSIGFLFFTKEMEDKNGKWHAAENVIHELGLCHNAFGLKKAIIIIEEGVTEPSNIRGIHQIRFDSKYTISEKFGNIVAIIRREFSML